MIFGDGVQPYTSIYFGDDVQQTMVFGDGVQPYPFVYFCKKWHDAHFGTHVYGSQPRGNNCSLITKEMWRTDKHHVVIQVLPEKEFYRVRYPWEIADYTKKSFEQRNWGEEIIPKTIYFKVKETVVYSPSRGWERYIVTREVEPDPWVNRWAKIETFECAFGDWSRTKRDGGLINTSERYAIHPLYI